MDERRRWSWLVWIWVVLTTVVMVGDVMDVTSSASATSEEPTAPIMQLYGVAISLIPSTAGALIFWKRPANRIGWLLLLGSLYFPASAFFSLVRPLVGPDLVPWAAWGQQVFWAVSIPPMVIFVSLLFPDGRLPSRRWRWVAWVGALGVFGLVFGNAVSPDLLDSEGLGNPAAFAGSRPVANVALAVGGSSFVVAFLAALASVGTRFRRSRGVQRLQMRWLFAGTGAAFLGWVVAVTFEIAGRPDAGGWIFATGFTLIPVAVAVAVLRYRLYEIERLVSRTVSYSATVLVLAGLYAGSVVGLGSALRGLAGEASGDLVVAASTLGVAAAFGPVRRRAHTVVDRRFNRARYDAARTVETFAARLRDQIDLGSVVRGLTTVTTETMSPVHASVWLPPTPGSVGLRASSPTTAT